MTGDDAAELSGTIAALPCTDGMSDLSFGLEAQIILQDDAGARQFSGCCTLTPQ